METHSSSLGENLLNSFMQKTNSRESIKLTKEELLSELDKYVNSVAKQLENGHFYYCGGWSHDVLANNIVVNDTIQGFEFDLSGYRSGTMQFIEITNEIKNFFATYWKALLGFKSRYFIDICAELVKIKGADRYRVELRLKLCDSIQDYCNEF